jgi:hypothetical protein
VSGLPDGLFATLAARRFNTILARGRWLAAVATVEVESIGGQGDHQDEHIDGGSHGGRYRFVLIQLPKDIIHRLLDIDAFYG